MKLMSGDDVVGSATLKILLPAIDLNQHSSSSLTHR